MADLHTVEEVTDDEDMVTDHTVCVVDMDVVDLE